MASADVNRPPSFVVARLGCVGATCHGGGSEGRPWYHHTGGPCRSDAAEGLRLGLVGARPGGRGQLGDSWLRLARGVAAEKNIADVVGLRRGLVGERAVCAVLCCW